MCLPVHVCLICNREIIIVNILFAITLYLYYWSLETDQALKKLQDRSIKDFSMKWKN